MRRRLGRAFLTIVRPVELLHEMLASDPYRAFRVSPSAKRIVVFLRDQPASEVTLPLELHGAHLLSLTGREVFGAYLPSPRGPVFMSLIERTFGKELTTRTWDTVARVARA
jgi:uncharacterized protein (DUF1697 family)